MFWEEKIDRLKKETASGDFRVPVTDWSTILKKIEDKFVIKQDAQFLFSGWGKRLRDSRKIKTIRMAQLNHELIKLNFNKNYWIALTGDNAATKNLVYESKPSVILKLLQLRHGDFYIVDKKYNWLAYFKYNQTNIEVFMSGERTPWD